MQLKLVYLRSENTTFPVKLKQLNQMCGLREGRRDERIAEMYTVTIVMFHDGPILQLPHCSSY